MSTIESIAQAVIKFSPAVATALGGPLAGMIATLLAHVFGSSTEGLSDAITADPDAAIKIKQFEIEHAEVMAKVNESEYSTEVQDRISARSNEKDDKHFWILATLSIIFVVSYFTFIAFRASIFSDAADAHQILDSVTNALFLILSYWFGSCHGNK